MLVLKIAGITLAVILAVIVIFLLLRLKLCLSYVPDGGIKFRVKILCFSFGGRKKKPKKKKKEGRFAKSLKKKFGLDALSNQEGDAAGTDISDRVSKIAALVMLFAGQIKWLFSKLRLDRLYAFIICGGSEDAADAAVQYGAVCAAVYPMAGYLTANVNEKKNAADIRIGCDFEGESRIQFELIISIRIYNLLTAVMRTMAELSDIAENTEDKQ